MNRLENISCESGYLSAMSLQRHKPVANRTKKPKWVQSHEAFNKHVAAANRRWMIARMYWLENKSARQIAETFNMRISAVQMCILRLSKT